MFVPSKGSEVGPNSPWGAALTPIVPAPLRESFVIPRVYAGTSPWGVCSGRIFIPSRSSALKSATSSNLKKRRILPRACRERPVISRKIWQV